MNVAGRNDWVEKAAAWCTTRSRKREARPAGLELARGERSESRQELEAAAQLLAKREARPAGLEPATPGLEGRCSIQLSYGRIRAQVLV